MRIDINIPYVKLFMKNSDNSVSSRLKEERQRLKMTQQESADCCGVAKKTFERWEAGTPISSDMLVKLAENEFDVIYLLLGIKLTDQPIKTEYNTQASSEHTAQISETPNAYLNAINSSNSAALAGIGNKWWQSVSELSKEEQDAILTLVFGSTISKQIRLIAHNDIS